MADPGDARQQAAGLSDAEAIVRLRTWAAIQPPQGDFGRDLAEVADWAERLLVRVQEAERALREIAKTTPNVHGYGVAVMTAPQMNALARAVLGGDVQE